MGGSLKTLLIAAVLYTPAPAVTTQQLIDRYADAHHYCDVLPAAHKPGDIVIQWVRASDGSCSIPVAKKY